jgi:Zn-dependent protease with chaperone function
LKNGTLYGILGVPLAAFCVCGYILWHWGNVEVYGVVLLLDAPIAFGTFLRLRNDSKSWYRRSTPIPRENPLYPRTDDLATKMGVPHHDLYVADSTLMAHRKAVGAITKGIRRHSIMFSDYFLRALNQEEQDAVISHELAHTKQSHALTSAITRLSYYFAGWNLFLFSAIPNLQTSNLPESWVSSIAGAGIFLFLGGIIIVQPYLAMNSQTEADEIAVNVLGSGDSLISGMKKLVESPEIMADQKKYRMAHLSLYGRMVRIQNLSRSLAARNLAQKDAV